MCIYTSIRVAEVVFKDVINNKNEFFSDKITGISGKGSTSITKDSVLQQTGQSVADIVAKYEALGYRLADNGDDFELNPTFNPQIIDVDTTDTPEESARREAARQQGNKKVIELRFIKQSNIIVKYENELGDIIQPELALVEKQDFGTAYDASTVEAKPQTIKAQDNKLYQFKEVKVASGDEAGSVKEDTVITYVYEEIKSNVVVKYYDEKQAMS